MQTRLVEKNVVGQTMVCLDSDLSLAPSLQSEARNLSIISNMPQLILLFQYFQYFLIYFFSIFLVFFKIAVRSTKPLHYQQHATINPPFSIFSIFFNIFFQYFFSIFQDCSQKHETSPLSATCRN